MPSKAALSTHLRAWRCPQCKGRSFSESALRRQLGPEHPRYIEIPQPPQQTLPYRPPVKGTLPIPRDIFSGKYGQVKANDAEIRKAAPLPARPRQATPGSREEWKMKMAEARRRNLAEGLKSLRSRRNIDERKEQARRQRQELEREERLRRPEREDERLTAPSHGLDLEKLFKGALPDPNREVRIARMKENVAQRDLEKQARRMDDMHTLYMHARTFIVTPAQLDAAVDEAFGTTEQPYRFGDYVTTTGQDTDLRSDSMWAHGPPMTVQDMLNKANRTKAKSAIENVGGFGQINRERIRRIAEGLTGGKMEDGSM